MDVVRKGSGGWKKVVVAFGEDILQDDGEIDRARLGQIVFFDPPNRQLLNRLLAPFISNGIFWEIVKLWIKGSKVIILDIPLLFEAKTDHLAKPIIVVWVDLETQLLQLMARDGISEEQARTRIIAQTPLDWKRTKADMVIDKSGTLDETIEQFQKVLTQVTRPHNMVGIRMIQEGCTLFSCFCYCRCSCIPKHITWDISSLSICLYIVKREPCIHSLAFLTSSQFVGTMANLVMLKNICMEDSHSSLQNVVLYI